MAKLWAKEEFEFLKANINEMTYKEIAKALSRSTCSVISKAKNENIRKNKSNKIDRWTKKEIKFLKENINNKSFEEIGKTLNRSAEGVKYKAYHLNLVRIEECPRCPRCNEKIKVGKVGFKTYFCRSCLTEFKENGKILEPLYK